MMLVDSAENHKMYRSLPFCNHVDHARCVITMNEAAIHRCIAKKCLLVPGPAIRVRKHKFNFPILLQILPYFRPSNFAVLEEVLRMLVHISEKVCINLVERNTYRKRMRRDQRLRSHGPRMEVKIEILG